MLSQNKPNNLKKIPSMSNNSTHISVIGENIWSKMSAMTERSFYGFISKVTSACIFAGQSPHFPRTSICMCWFEQSIPFQKKYMESLAFSRDIECIKPRSSSGYTLLLLNDSTRFWWFLLGFTSIDVDFYVFYYVVMSSWCVYELVCQTGVSQMSFHVKTTFLVLRTMSILESARTP